MTMYSGVFTQTFLDILTGTAGSWGTKPYGTNGLDDYNVKVALYNDSVAITNVGSSNPTFDSASANYYGVAPWNANEVTNNGGAGSWPAGGVAPDTATTFTISKSSSGTDAVLTFDLNDVTEADVTIASAAGALVYISDTGTGGLTNLAICGVDFGASVYSSTDGEFKITWNSAGVFTATFAS